MKTLLLVEDDPSIRTPLSMYLEKFGYRIVGIGNGLEVVTFLRTNRVDLVILDINLPGKDGLTLCREIRSEWTIPIIMLSARWGEEDKVTALEWGADDYVPKPFSSRELVARIATVLKRAIPKAPHDSATALSDIHLGKMKLEGANYRLLINDSEIRLTKTEFLLLHRLSSSVGHIVERETLMKETFGYENYLYDRTIDTHIKNLRRKMADSVKIETVRAVGYRLTMP